MRTLVYEFVILCIPDKVIRKNEQIVILCIDI